MNEGQAKEDVIRAGKQLIKAGLIARTWGNVSARISEDHFAITPSGRAYETLTPAEIVTVNTRDGSYPGEIKPSSEKGIHTAIYRERPEINFVIHTHQVYASVVSALHRDIELSDSAGAAAMGCRRIPCAAYGLPGSKKLKRNVIEALSRSKGKAFLMANHGALCLGENRDEAFEVAAVLEQICSDFIMSRYLQISGRKKPDWDGLRAYYLEELSPGGSLAVGPPGGPLYSSERSGNHLKLYLDDDPVQPFLGTGKNCIRAGLEGLPENNDLPPELAIHRLIYRKFKEIRAILHTTSPDILTVSKTGRTLYPLIDDFAQIVGVSVRAAAGGPLPAAARMIAGKMRGRHAVMIEGNGALCCGPSRSDAAAAAQILDKGCRALIGTALFGGARPVNPVESLLMRLVYLTTYARKAAE